MQGRKAHGCIADLPTIERRFSMSDVDRNKTMARRFLTPSRTATWLISLAPFTTMDRS